MFKVTTRNNIGFGEYIVPNKYETKAMYFLYDLLNGLQGHCGWKAVRQSFESLDKAVRESEAKND